MLHQFQLINKMRGSYLFQEGNLADHVYLVISGEFRVTKKIQREKESFYTDSQKIIKDPLKVKR